MGIFLPSKRPVPRRFSYEPRYYDPSREESLRTRLRIARKTKRAGNPNRALFYGVLLVIVLYFLMNT